MKDLVLGDLDRKVNASAVISASLILTLVLLVTHIPCSNLCGTRVRTQECKRLIKLWDECCTWSDISIFPTPYPLVCYWGFQTILCAITGEEESIAKIKPPRTCGRFFKQVHCISAHIEFICNF